MKKIHHIAGAVAALCAAGGAQAQSSVQITGYADASVVLERGGATGSVNKLGSGGSGPSRLIFRGTEDLGGGSNAFFHLEAGTTYDTGGSLQQQFFGRQAFTGIGGGWGTLRLGLMFTPAFTALRDVGDPFRMSYAGNAGNIFTVGVPGGPKSIGFPNTSAATGIAQGGISRANTVLYATPNFSGFSGELAYSFGEQPDDNSKLRSVSASAGYAQGPLNVRLAYLNTANAAGNAEEKNLVAVGNYDFGVARLYLGYGTNRGYTGAKSVDYLIGANVPLGQGYLLASIAKKNDKSATNSDPRQIAVGYVYQLSKRTQLHASYARIKNTVPNSSPAFWTVASPAGPGSGDKALIFGIGHLF